MRHLLKIAIAAVTATAALTTSSLAIFRQDPATGDFGDAKVIRKFGDVPEDLSAL